MTTDVQVITPITAISSSQKTLWIFTLSYDYLNTLYPIQSIPNESNCKFDAFKCDNWMSSIKNNPTFVKPATFSRISSSFNNEDQQLLHPINLSTSIELMSNIVQNNIKTLFMNREENLDYALNVVINLYLDINVVLKGFIWFREGRMKRRNS